MNTKSIGCQFEEKQVICIISQCLSPRCWLITKEKIIAVQTPGSHRLNQVIKVRTSGNNIFWHHAPSVVLRWKGLITLHSSPQWCITAIQSWETSDKTTLRKGLQKNNWPGLLKSIKVNKKTRKDRKTVADWRRPTANWQLNAMWDLGWDPGTENKYQWKASKIKIKSVL